MDAELGTTNLLQKKWGDALNGGFVVIPAALLRQQHQLGLDNGEALLLMNLLMSWWKPRDWPFPHTSTLAKRMGVSRRTIQRYVESLEEKKLIRRIWMRDPDREERSMAKYDLSGIIEQLKHHGRAAHPSRTTTTPPTGESNAGFPAGAQQTFEATS